MEMSMYIDHKLAKRVPIFHPISSHKYSYKPIISCQLSMQTGKKPDFYKILGLNSQNVSFDDIKKAYRTMALRYHPDVCTDRLAKEESTRRFMELRKAYETLSDPNLRRIYDCELGLEDRSESRSGARKVWEMQLDGLRVRSDQKMKRKMGM